MGRLLFVILLFLPIAFCLDPVAFRPQRDCMNSSSHTNRTWIGHLYNKEGWIGEAAFISPRHILTKKEVVMYSSNGREYMVDSNDLNGMYYVKNEPLHFFHIQSILVPAFYESGQAMQYEDLAILQLQKPISEGTTSPICLPDSSDMSNSTVYAFFAERDSVLKQKVSYRYSHNNKFLISETGKGSADNAILTDEFDRIIGIALNETTAINIRYWEEFICEHTGICMKGDRMQNWQRISANYYKENGNLFAISICSHAHYANKIKNSTTMIKLSPGEVTKLRRTCGDASDNLFSPVVIISAENQICNVDECKIEALNCTGTLISQLHVITSADCIQKLNVSRTAKTFVYYTDSRRLSASSTASTSSSDDPRIISMSSRTYAYNIVAPPVDNSNPKIIDVERAIIHNIAILELYEPIPEESFTKPICLAGRSDSIPDSLTLHYLTEAEEFIKSTTIRYRQTRKMSAIRDDVNENSSDIVWDYDLKQKPIIHKTTCKDCQYNYFDYPEMPLGSPIIHSINGRLSLHAVTTRPDSKKNRAMRPAYFATFICIHTGICEDGETFTERNLLPYDITDREMPPESMMTHSAARPKSWQSVLQDHELLRDHKENRLNRLNATEYTILRDECGSSSNGIKPYFVRITVKTRPSEPEFPWPRTMCYGVFISRRHVIIKRPCALELLNHKESYVDNERRNESFPLFEREKIRLVLIPDQNKPDIKQGMAIVELKKDVVPGHDNKILCLLDYQKWVNEQSYRQQFICGYCELHDRFLCNSEDDLKMQRDLKTGHISYKKVNERAWLQLCSDRIGNPILRRETLFSKSRRYYFDGILYGVSPKSLYLVEPYNLMMKDICRLTGVCPEPDDNPLWNDEHGVFVNGRSGNEQRLCQPPINY